MMKGRILGRASPNNRMQGRRTQLASYQYVPGAPLMPDVGLISVVRFKYEKVHP